MNILKLIVLFFSMFYTVLSFGQVDDAKSSVTMDELTISEFNSPDIRGNSLTPKSASSTSNNTVLFCHPSLFSDHLFITLKATNEVTVQLKDEVGVIVFEEKTTGYVVNKKYAVPEDLPSGQYELSVKGQEMKPFILRKR